MARRIKSAYKILNVVHEGLFSATRGLIGGRAGGMVVVKLTTVGRRSGEERSTMLTSPLVEGDTVVLIASFRGGPNHPAWYHNLRAQPRVRAQRRGSDLTMDARVLEGDERDRMWERVVALEPRYAEYQRNTERTIPVVVLTPAV